ALVRGADRRRGGRRAVASGVGVGEGSGASGGGGLGCGDVCGVQFGFEAGGELVEEFVGDVLDQAAAELGGATGDGQVGVDGDLGGPVRGAGQPGGDAGARRTVASAVLALGLHDRVVSRLV